MNTLPNIPDILQEHVPLEEFLTPTDVRFILNPYTWQLHNTTVLHVVLQLHFIGRDFSTSIHGCAVQTFTEDSKTPQPENTRRCVPRSATFSRSTPSVAVQPTPPSTPKPEVLETFTLPDGYMSPRASAVSPQHLPVSFHFRLTDTHQAAEQAIAASVPPATQMPEIILTSSVPAITPTPLHTGNVGLPGPTSGSVPFLPRYSWLNQSQLPRAEPIFHPTAADMHEFLRHPPTSYLTSSWAH